MTCDYIETSVGVFCPNVLIYPTGPGYIYDILTWQNLFGVGGWYYYNSLHATTNGRTSGQTTPRRKGSGI